MPRVSILPCVAGFVYIVAPTLAGCGGSVTSGLAPDAGAPQADASGDSLAATDGPAGDAAPSPDGGPAVDARAVAVRATITNNAACSGLTAFYWEVGDRDGLRASGTGGDPTAAPVDANAAMPIASASKLLFGAYALEKRTLDDIVASGDDVYLNFTSGYDNLGDLSCDVTTTVGACFMAGMNDTRSDADVGKFYYNGGHLQAYAVNVAALGDDHRTGLARPLLADDIEAAIGGVGLSYTVPQLAGGAAVAPSGYAAFLRRILAGTLRIHDVLGARAVCAWTNHPDECNAIYSPVNQTLPGGRNDVSDYKWHYALAHWVEDDGAFSSPGKFGFYPWIDASKRYYGILARYDNSATRSPPPYFSSVVCGRLIRTAWLSGEEQR